jgi:hypothetical protein
VSIPHRGNRELKVFYKHGDISDAEVWFLDFADVLGTGSNYEAANYSDETVDRVKRCKHCSVPPEPQEWGFTYRIVHPQPGLGNPGPPDEYEWLCLDCAYDTVVEALPWLKVDPIPPVVLAENAERWK